MPSSEGAQHDYDQTHIVKHNIFPEMKKIFGLPAHSRKDEKENEKAHSSFIGKKFIIGKHSVVVEVGSYTI